MGVLAALPYVNWDYFRPLFVLCIILLGQGTRPTLAMLFANQDKAEIVLWSSSLSLPALFSSMCICQPWTNSLCSSVTGTGQAPDWMSVPHATTVSQLFNFLFLILFLSISEKEIGTLNTKKLACFRPLEEPVTERAPLRAELGADVILSVLYKCLFISMDVLTETNVGFFQSLASPIYKRRKGFKTLVIENRNK